MPFTGKIKELEGFFFVLVRRFCGSWIRLQRASRTDRRRFLSQVRWLGDGFG
ncbi:hypothetical protein CCACVL1_19857 [Corchorus capsularis]|uniref:Uncharacterized protein n=1 Tax=Corchorus capsularis TaxID=210143 RepID=A0A1R3HEE8_COCAP|nr:hypothetical protein CCACVL1_19857 [Corchorus capsularis]